MGDSARSPQYVRELQDELKKLQAEERELLIKLRKSERELEAPGTLTLGEQATNEDHQIRLLQSQNIALRREVAVLEKEKKTLESFQGIQDEEFARLSELQEADGRNALRAEIVEQTQQLNDGRRRIAQLDAAAKRRQALIVQLCERQQFFNELLNAQDSESTHLTALGCHAVSAPHPPQLLRVLQSEGIQVPYAFTTALPTEPGYQALQHLQSDIRRLRGLVADVEASIERREADIERMVMLSEKVDFSLKSGRAQEEMLRHSLEQDEQRHSSDMERVNGQFTREAEELEGEMTQIQYRLQASLLAAGPVVVK